MNGESKHTSDTLRDTAPELLEACKWVLREIEWGHDMRASTAILKQAINKAEGIE